MYTVTLSDGTQLANLELSGNTFIAASEISDSVFTGKLSEITISDGTTTETHNEMVLRSNYIINGCSHFALTEKTPAEKAEERLASLETALDDIIVSELEV